MAWSRLTGINGYSDAPTQAVNIKDFISQCGKSCQLLCDSEQMKLAELTGFEVIRVMVKYVGPRSYDVLFQLYERRSQHSILENWFGSACCGDCAEAKAYRDYLDNKL